MWCLLVCYLLTTSIYFLCNAIKVLGHMQLLELADSLLDFLPSPTFFTKALEQAQEVQSGLWLLQQALSLLRTSVTNTALHSHIDNSVRNVLSINAVLRSLNIQVRVPSYKGKEINCIQRKVNSKGNVINSNGQFWPFKTQKNGKLSLVLCHY